MRKRSTASVDLFFSLFEIAGFAPILTSAGREAA
jgi:hypothetical protein